MTAINLYTKINPALAVKLNREVGDIAILLGRDGIDATAYVDAGEARELGEALLEMARTLAGNDRCPICGSDDVPKPGANCVHCDGECGCASDAECLAEI